MKAILTTMLFVVIFSACKKVDNGDCQTNASLRKGAKCKDGTSSNATGSGACSNHGGVDYWICK